MQGIEIEVRKAYSDSTDYFPAKQYGIKADFVEKGEIQGGKLVEVMLTNESSEEFSGVIHIKQNVVVSEKDYAGNVRFFMPGYMYGDNTADMPNHGRKEFPRICLNASSRPESEYWMTRSDRLAEPMSIVFHSGKVYALGASPYLLNDDGSFKQFCGFTCGIKRVEESSDGSLMAHIGYTLGYENAPWLFVQTATVLDREPVTEKNCFTLLSGEKVKVEIRMYEYASESATGINEAIKDVYETFHKTPRTIEGMTVEKATKLLSEAIRDYAWLPEERMYSGFVYDTPEGYKYNRIGSLTWTNGMSVACPMLLAGNRLQDEKMREQALSFIDEVINNSFNPASSLLYEAVSDGKWSTRGWWYSGMHSGGHSSYLNGQAVYYILKSYLSEKKHRDTNHDNWLSFVKPVIEKVNSVKNTDNEYPFSMSEKTGAGIEYDSLGGAWCLAVTALYSQITGDNHFMAGMIVAEQHYYDEFVKKMVCYGGPLDTDKAVENESILAYIRAVRILHEMTGETKFLEHMRDAIYYELSFKLGYNTPVTVKPLSEIGWSSCGGSITSVANPHIHPMSSTIIDEMIYYTDNVKDSYVESRLKDTVLWGMQTFNTYDKEYGYGRIGWMSERFCFCQGLLTEKYPDGSPASTWFALMPWAGASVIEGFVGECWEKY